MKVLILFLSIFIHSQARSDENFDNAVRKSTEAFLSYPTMKKAKKRIEKKIYRYIPVEKKTAAIIGSTILTATKGELNTKVIKKLDIKMMGGKIRPDVVYNFKDGSSGGAINMNWDF